MGIESGCSMSFKGKNLLNKFLSITIQNSGESTLFQIIHFHALARFFLLS